MARVWVSIEDRAPSGTDPIVGVYGSVKSAIAGTLAAIGRDATVEKDGVEIVITLRGKKYYINQYFVRT